MIDHGKRFGGYRVVDSLCIDQPLAGEQDGKLSAVQLHPKGAVSMRN
jgi:hypothetical protein